MAERQFVTGITESDYEAIIDRRVQRALRLDPRYVNADSAEAQSEAEEKIEAEISAEVDAQYTVVPWSL